MICTKKGNYTVILLRYTWLVSQTNWETYGKTYANTSLTRTSQNCSGSLYPNWSSFRIFSNGVFWSEAAAVLKLTLWATPLKGTLCYFAEQSQCVWTSFLLEGSNQEAPLEVWHQICSNPSHLDYGVNGWLTFYVCSDRKIEQRLNWNCSRGTFQWVILRFYRKHQDCPRCHCEHYVTNWFDLLLLFQIIF